MAATLGADARQSLLDLARRAIETYLRDRRRLRAGFDFGPISPEPRGAFVSLHTRRGDLRGCIGTILPVGPLDQTVAEMALSAAVHDPRFHPVTLSELSELHLEISALTVPERVPHLAAIEVGRHGLIVSRSGRKGLLLPQVAPEWGWGREEFLRQTCVKAGLAPDSWKDPATLVEWFEAEVWGEGSEK